MTLALLLNHNLGFAGGVAVVIPPVAEPTPARSGATGPGGGGGVGAEIVPIRFVVVEMAYEPVIAQAWLFVPSLIRQDAPALLQFEAYVLPLGKIIPMATASLVATVGVRGGTLHKELAEHRHETEITDLRSRLQDIEDMRFLGLL